MEDCSRAGEGGCTCTRADSGSLRAGVAVCSSTSTVVGRYGGEAGLRIGGLVRNLRSAGEGFGWRGRITDEGMRRVGEAGDGGGGCGETFALGIELAEEGYELADGEGP